MSEVSVVEKPWLTDPVVWTQKYRVLKKKPFSLDGRDFLKILYRDLHPRILIKKGRQVEITETGLNWMLFHLLTNNDVTGLYSAPRMKQVSVFSWSRWGKAFRESPKLMRTVGDKKMATHYSFRNGSEMHLLSCWAEAGQIEGIPCDFVFLDEYQKVPVTAKEIIESTLDHSSFKDDRLGIRGRMFIAGKPIFANTAFERHWKNSDQKEWRDGQWIPLKPENLDVSGYHISQTFCPWISPSEIDYRKRNYSEQQFMNEVLGEFYTGLGAPLTIDDILRCADRRLTLLPSLAPPREGYLGVDWGETATVAIFERRKDKLVLIYIKELPETLIEQQVKKIRELYVKFNVRQGVADFGYGAHQNQQLQKSFGDRHRACYWGVNLKSNFAYDPKRMLITGDRTFWYDEILIKLKQPRPRDRTFVFPYHNPSEVEWAFDQFTNLAVEYVEPRVGGTGGYKRYVRTGDDHAFHALIYAYIASMKPKPPQARMAGASRGAIGRTRHRKF